MALLTDSDRASGHIRHLQVAPLLRPESAPHYLHRPAGVSRVSLPYILFCRDQRGHADVSVMTGDHVAALGEVAGSYCPWSLRTTVRGPVPVAKGGGVVAQRPAVGL
jgi:hypothetical protein